MQVYTKKDLQKDLEDGLLFKWQQRLESSRFEAMNFWVSHVGAGLKGFEPSFTAFPVPKQATAWEVEQLRHKLVH